MSVREQDLDRLCIDTIRALAMDAVQQANSGHPGTPMASGELARLMDDDGLRGVTSNPAIFEKAMAGSSDYESALKELEGRKDLDAKALYEILAVRDIQDAADVLAPVYVATRRRDGSVSLEVSPDLAHDTRGTVTEARRLWRALGRENAMIKVPATPAGIPAARQLISEGINVNVTLLFAREAYERASLARRRSAPPAWPEGSFTWSDEFMIVDDGGRAWIATTCS